jgi:chemotaxis methyl-accepting protein methylase
MPTLAVTHRRAFAPARPPEMSPAEHQLWRGLIRARYGLDFPISRLPYLRKRLAARMGALGLDSYDGYYRHLSRRLRVEREPIELDALLESLLNHQSTFFRHAPSFDALANRVLPDLLQAGRARGPSALTMWSAGCASGQEAYSMAMVLLARPDSDLWRVRITATDLGRDVLRRAREGRFRPDQVEAVPELYRRMFLDVERGEGGESYRVVDTIRSLVEFRPLNLADPDADLPPPQDVIFCQNVLIYFDPDDRPAVVDRLISRLNPGGFLILGPAEVLGLKRPGLRPVAHDQAVLYRRVD